MDELIQLFEYPVKNVLELLLKDKTTKKNIIFATDAYIESNSKITPKTQITVELLRGLNSFVIQPRVYKSMNEQEERTKKNAEVFTPAWICNTMINDCDEKWIGYSNAFNFENNKSWITTENKVHFNTNQDWKKYVDSNRLEVSCGEAPYIVSRYDVETGELIDIHNRIGILDRKLRIVTENTDTEEEWIKWAYRAYQSVYGFEFQGDNLLVARINLLNTFVDYIRYCWNRDPNDKELKNISEIIVWNFWQMNGITMTSPYSSNCNNVYQTKLTTNNNESDILNKEEMVLVEKHEIPSKIFDWRSNKSIEFREILEGNREK